MIDKDQLIKYGYQILPFGGCLYIDAEMMPKDWHDVCSDFGLDHTQRGAWLAICAVKQEFWKNDEGE